MSDKDGHERVYKAIQYHEKNLKIAKEIGDRAGQGGAYGNLGNACDSLGDYQKPSSIMKKILKLQKKSVIGPEKDELMEISVTLTSHWVTIKKPSTIMKNV